MKIPLDPKPVYEHGFEWGPVKVVAGRHKGRIGYLDDEDLRSGIVYFGEMLTALKSHRIPFRYLSRVTISDLVQRQETLMQLLKMPSDMRPYAEFEEPDHFIDHLSELAYVQQEMMERFFSARLSEGSGRRVFISHSSKDKQFASWLAADLADQGHQPWLDEWRIKAGDSIPKAIASALEECDFIVVVLSENGVTSNWVEREWHDKYWDEVSSGTISVIPVLLRACEIPRFLRTKKYADFTGEYNHGLEQVLIALSGHKS